ncbi:MAG: dihydrolipoamide acetyltransferase family protein [Thermoleophilia bacterium]
MATEVKLPRLGQGMEAGTIVRWLKSEGDTVQKGEPLYELDTDKVTQEVEAEAGGVLLKIAIPEGEVEVGKTIAVIGEAGEEVTEAFGEGEDEQTGAAESDDAAESAEKPARAPARDAEREAGREASADAPTEPEQQATNGGQPEANGGRVKASPLARRIARERGVDLAALSGTGPEGRVVAEDVERAAASDAPTKAPAPVAAAVVPSGEVEVEVEKLSSLRKTIARRMTEAWQAPAFQIAMSADMSRALALRESMVERLQEGETKPTISDVLTKICASALMRHRDVNALFADDTIELHPSANIGIAVAIPKGLVVPVIPQCERKSIAEIAAVRADLVESARSGKLRQEDLEGGTFTISNLGMYGVERFVAVLNPPQAAILAVGAAEQKAVVREGEVVARPMLELTLTCDHRSLDGATAAEFLRTVKTYLEEPGLAL